MQFYGNKTWNNATDNRDKSIIPMRENQFAEMLIFLEHSGLNFYAYVKDGSAVLAVNSSDIDKLKNVLGSQLDGLNIGKSAKPFSPPQKNIIGTIPYRNIWEREYLSYDRDTALKVAEQLEKAGIGYSGVIYSNGKATLTVNRHDQERAEEIGQTVVDMRKQYTSDVQAEKVIGNIDYKNIPDKRVMFTELTSQDYEAIRNYLDRNCEYSGLIRGGKVMFAVAAENVPKFEKALNTILDIQSVTEELVNKGFSKDQILSLNHLISKSVDQDMELSIVSFFEPDYTPEQFAEMTEILERAADETILQRYKEDSAFSNAIDLKKRFEREAELAEIYALHPYSDEQKTAISEIYTEYFPRSIFEEMDESYTPEEMRKMADIIQHFTNYSEVENFIKDHRKRMMITEENMPIYAALIAHEPVYLHKENSRDGYEFHNERIEYNENYGFVIVGDTDVDSDLVHRYLYTRSAEEVVTDFIQGDSLIGYIIDGVTAPETSEQSAEISPEISEESPIHFGLLGNGITAYDISRTDPQTNDYPVVAHISEEGVVKIYDDTISAEDRERINEQAKSAREKFLSEWGKLSTIAQYQRLMDNADISTLSNIHHEKLSMEEKIEKYMPFVFFKEGERPEPEQPKSYRIYQLPDGEKYHGIRFEGREQLEKDGVQLNHEDYALVYVGEIRDFKGISTLENLYTEFNSNRPDDFTGRSLSVSDVVVISDNGTETAYFCDKSGFTEMPEFFREKEITRAKTALSVSDLEVGDVILYEGKRREVEKISEHSISLKDLDAPNYGGILLGTSDVLAYNGWQQDMEEKGFEILSKSEKSAPVVDTPEQVFELNPPKREPEKLQTLQQVVDKFFGTDCESAETEGGTWKLTIADGDKVGELFYGGEPVCGIYNRGEKMEIEPYRELTTFPELLRTAMLEHNPDKPVEIMEFQRTFETPLDKAKWLINEFSENEYEITEDFADMHNIGLAFTTLTDDELPIQVTADLVDFKITYEFDGEVFKTEQYESIEDMVENGLTGLNFDDLVDVPDEVVERHTKKEEQTVELMSDISEVQDISTSTEDVPPVTLKYKGDAESLDEIRDKALSLGATVAVDNEEGVIFIDTYENHKAELDGLAYELGVMAVGDAPAVDNHAEETADIDKPLFTDAAVIEEIQQNENADIPFWETPAIEGEQLTLFGDSEPIQQKKPEKPKSQFASGPVVDGVQVYEALAKEIDRGTGFVDGKLRVQDFFEKSNPTTQQLADFLKKEYGTGGHSGDGRISLVDYDSKGLTFSFENGEKFRHSWYNVATMVKARLDMDTYLTDKEKAKRQALANEKGEDLPDRKNSVSVGDKFRNKMTGVVSEVVSLTGALPFYTEDCTVKRLSGAIEVTENIPYSELLNADRYEFIGKAELENTVLENSEQMEEVIPETEKPNIQKQDKFVPVYKGDWEIADNRKLYREIVDENRRFAEMAKKVIGNGLDPADSVKALTEEFGFERTAWLTALNIAAHPLDGRFYPSDKKWASDILSPFLEIKPDEMFANNTEKRNTFNRLIDGGMLHGVHNTHLAQFAESLIPEYAKYLERSAVEEHENPISVTDELRKIYHDGKTAFYCFTNQDSQLNLNTLPLITEKSEQYLIAAASCILSDEFMQEHNITFLKYGRDLEYQEDTDHMLQAMRDAASRVNEDTEIEKPEIPTIKNLAQLKKAIKPDMMFEITDHLRPECIGERRVVTGVSSVDFMSRKLDENGEPTGKDLHMEFDHAKNWTFDGSELTSRLDNGDVLMSFHFIDSLEREQTVQAEKEPEIAPELSVGDHLEYRGKEYKVESLDMGGFITLCDTALENAPRIFSRVTFLADEFLKSGDFKIIAPEKSEKMTTPEKGENFTITDDALGEGGAKAKFNANITAIQTLKQLEKENRPATAEEKEILSRYVGWGGLAPVFEENNPRWSDEHKILTELLTAEEYRSARSSTLDAFYTTPVVIDSIFDALQNFGFEGGNVLEPSCGVGNFFGRMPEDMRSDSSLYGVEIDSVSGKIAKALYPDADIAIQGFEKNTFQNGSFDVIVGNVPFGNLSFQDTRHNTTKLHDFFFAESLDKLKEGGIIALVTSAGTLDKQNESVRKMLAQRADLIGAIRLPSNTFKQNANTEVTTDIIFLQKRSEPPAELPDWVHIGETENGLPINQYFAENPDMVLGKVVEGNKLYSNVNGTMVLPFEGKDLKELLHDAVSKLSAQISDERPRNVYAKAEQGEIPIPADLRNYSFFAHDNNVYFKTSDRVCAFRFDTKNSHHRRTMAFIELRDITRELLTAQERGKPDSEISALQAKLNTVYDNFYNKYGLLHSRTNRKLFSEDVSYNLVCSLEKEFDKNKLIAKSDLFSKRTIKPPKPVDHVETAMEALTLSSVEKACVDFDYMSELTGMTEKELKKELEGQIFKVPHTINTYQTASEYLSGDIFQKLKQAQEAAEYDSDFNINVTALKKAMPEPLKAGDIDVKIGATWIEPEIYQQFLYELLQTPPEYRADVKRNFWQRSNPIEVSYSEATGMFHIEKKRQDMSVNSAQKYGTKKMTAYEIMEQLLNLKDPKIYKTIEVTDEYGEPKEKRVIDPEATRVVQKKAEKIREEFKKWIFRDPQRRETLVARYNELFNSIRPREYDGSALTFPLMNAEIQLHEHQKNAIAHALFGGNTLFAHSVGAGKTFEMIATAMEAKRLGLCTKSLFAVPNHLTEQIGADFRKLYPGANILVATKDDFKKENRQKLFAKIATGNFDAVIIGHSQLGMIPVSRERQIMTIQSQIDNILQGIEELKKREGSKFQIKAMERTRKSLQKQLDKLKKSNQDDTLTFEELGIDRLFVDEAHEFKNLFVQTKLSNLSGVSTSASQKALDLFLKCRYLDEKTGGKGIIFSTGTPLSNSVTELHTMMRYLEYDFLASRNLQNFDNWITIFGEQKTDWELAPAGNRFKERTRIANYTGIPELMSMFKQIADIRTAETLQLDVPEHEVKIVNVEATELQQELVQELADRADAINSGSVDPTIDNMLKITSDGRKLGLDPRLIDPSFEDNPETKLNKCVENVLRIHKETESDRLTQIIFCDLGVPHKNSTIEQENSDDSDEKSAAERESLEEECQFCVYDDIKKKLIAGGIPESEIAFIHDAKTEKQKAELFEKVRNGEIRCLLGSTGKMGTGTNVQKRLIAVHDLDIPWRPADLEQRAGRIIRQGNENPNVEIYRYVTKGTFDAYSYQTLEKKQRFISQIMTSKDPSKMMRKCEDVDQQAFSYAEIKALCTGDERVREMLILDNEVKELAALVTDHENTVFEMQDKVAKFPEREQRLLTALDNLKSDREHLRKLPIDPETKLPVFKITINGTEYTDRKDAAKAFETAVLAIKIPDTPVQIGEFQGFPLSVTVNSNYLGGGVNAEMRGAYPHSVKLIESFAHNLRRLESGLYKIDMKINDIQNDLARLRADNIEAQKILNEPFPQESELKEKQERLKIVTEELNKAALEAKRSAPKKETCYFQIAQLKKAAMKRHSQAKGQEKQQAQETKKPNVDPIG